MSHVKYCNIVLYVYLKECIVCLFMKPFWTIFLTFLTVCSLPNSAKHDNARITLCKSSSDSLVLTLKGKENNLRQLMGTLFC